jgi:hypothetical protein
MIEEVTEAIQRWPEFAALAGVEASEVARISAAHQFF